MIKKIFLGILVFLSMINFKSVNSEIFIKAKVNNQIITNFDEKNEKNYLLALNPNFRNLSDENINRYAIDSVINEKIKKNEIEKRFEILKNKNVIEKVIQDLYSGIGIKLDTEIQFNREYVFYSSVGRNLEDNFDEKISRPSSQLKLVRTEIVDYLQQSSDDFYVANMQHPSKNSWPSNTNDWQPRVSGVYVHSTTILLINLYQKGEYNA